MNMNNYNSVLTSQNKHLVVHVDREDLFEFIIRHKKECRRCFLCGEVGHLRAMCPHNKMKKARRSQKEYSMIVYTTKNEGNE